MCHFFKKRSYPDFAVTAGRNHASAATTTLQFAAYPYTTGKQKAAKIPNKNSPF